jgi:outer membrane protein TolC
MTNVEQYAATETDLQPASMPRASPRGSRTGVTRRLQRIPEVLEAQRSLNIGELLLIRNRQVLLAADVDLMKALGGGWRPGSRLR